MTLINLDDVLNLIPKDNNDVVGPKPSYLREAILKLPQCSIDKGNMYLIPESLLISLQEDSLKLEALECAGVDNWEGYGFNFDEVVHEYSLSDDEDLTFRDVAEDLVRIKFKRLEV